MTLLSTLEKASKRKTSDHLQFPAGPEVLDLAERLAVAKTTLRETEASYETMRGQLNDIVAPWHAQKCAMRGKFIPAVDIGPLCLSLGRRWCRIDVSQADRLKELVGEELFEKYFRLSVSMRVRREVAEDPERLEQVVDRLQEMLGDEFWEIFEADRSLAPTDRYSLDVVEMTPERQAEMAAVVKRVPVISFREEAR